MYTLTCTSKSLYQQKDTTISGAHVVFCCANTRTICVLELQRQRSSSMDTPNIVLYTSTHCYVTSHLLVNSGALTRSAINLAVTHACRAQWAVTGNVRTRSAPSSAENRATVSAATNRVQSSFQTALTPASASVVKPVPLSAESATQRSVKVVGLSA